jgi:hypothetical protein
MHFTLTQSLVAASTAAAAWLMVRAGVAKGMLNDVRALRGVRTPPHRPRLSMP